jgi:hypothetical protein
VFPGIKQNPVRIRMKLGRKEEIEENLNDHLDGSSDTPIVNGFTLGFQVGVSAIFDGVLPLVMDEEGALLCLLVRMPANFHQRFNHPLKGVDFVVPDDEAKGFGLLREQVLLLQFLFSIFRQRGGAGHSFFCKNRARLV